MVIVPAIGVPSELVLQDTLKSSLVATFAIAAAIVFTWQARDNATSLHVHGLFWLPASLAIFSWLSTYWSNAYLASVEATRWFVFSLLFLVGSNAFTPQRVSRLAWGIHLGAVVASFWAANQYWSGFSIFPQGPSPASTFVNRNIYAEYLVCTVPFSAYLIAITKSRNWTAFLAITLGLNLVGLSMTGTRSALAALILISGLIPAAIWTNRQYYKTVGWSSLRMFMVLTLLTLTFLWLGSFQTNNRKLIAEFGAISAIDRGLNRIISTTKAAEYVSGSFSVRLSLWKTTIRMIAANPVSGVGAGAWEVQAPRFQDSERGVEDDYYAHNELLQLIAEYGLLGWTFLIALSIYIAVAIVRTARLPRPQAGLEVHLRYFSLISLMSLLLISGAGFPWRMATTGALFTLLLAILAASDLRIGLNPPATGYLIKLKVSWTYASMGILTLAFAMALYVTKQAFTAESSLITGIKWIATATMPPNSDDDLGRELKSKGLALVRNGIDINPHYRKLTPIAADLLAASGDWENALWIWESILESRPYVTAIIYNIAKAHLQMGNLPKAQQYLDRAIANQPGSVELQALQEQIWLKTTRDKVGSSNPIPINSLRK